MTQCAGCALYECHGCLERCKTCKVKACTRFCMDMDRKECTNCAYASTEEQIYIYGSDAGGDERDAYEAGEPYERGH